MYKPVVLVVLDGWGINSNTEGNAIKKAFLPTIDKLNQNYPLLALQASGISAGIPWGEPGNSEVGHTIMGSGKIIYQNLPRITLAIQNRSFFSNEALYSGIQNTIKNNSSLHLMGLISKGSIHSNKEHLFALLEMAKEQNVKNVFLHIFTDGRDSQPTSGIQIVREIQDKMKMIGVGKIASICGRNWAMDRNNNWDRIEKAYRMLVNGEGEKINDPLKYLDESYKKDITDEYLNPAVVMENNNPVALIKDTDTVVFFNFREDRARQLTKAFVIPEFKKIKRDKLLKITFVTMTEYEKDLPTKVMFSPEKTRNGLGEILSKYGKKQLRIAETEKYAHVTYFFNGGREEPWSGEDRILIPSPSVAKYDSDPEMSASKLTQKTINAIEMEKYDFILLNYANADMVGHTGNIEAAIKAVTSIDKSLSLLIPSVLEKGGCLLITADHGNVEEMVDPYSGQVITEHSTNPVPLWMVAKDNHRKKTKAEIADSQENIRGLLSDIAPTVLDIIDIPKPTDMNSESLLPILK